MELSSSNAILLLSFLMPKKKENMHLQTLLTKKMSSLTHQTSRVQQKIQTSSKLLYLTYKLPVLNKKVQETYQCFGRDIVELEVRRHRGF